MQSLIYFSSATKLLSDNDLIDILNISRINNERHQITGLLIYHEGSILQILEGTEDSLDIIFDKIQKDNRHKGIMKFGNFSIAERSFPSWSMGFKKVSKEDWSKLKGFTDLNNKDEFSWIAVSGNTRVITMIKAFANVNMLNNINFESE